MLFTHTCSLRIFSSLLSLQLNNSFKPTPTNGGKVPSNGVRLNYSCVSVALGINCERRGAMSCPRIL